MQDIKAKILSESIHHPNGNDVIRLMLIKDFVVSGCTKVLSSVVSHAHTSLNHKRKPVISCSLARLVKLFLLHKRGYPTGVGTAALHSSGDSPCSWLSGFVTVSMCFWLFRKTSFLQKARQRQVMDWMVQAVQNRSLQRCRFCMYVPIFFQPLDQVTTGFLRQELWRDWKRIFKT